MRHRPPASRSAGIALVLVLWILALLSVIAASVVFGARTDIQVAANLVAQAQREATAQAAVHRAIFELLKPVADPARWQSDGRPHAWHYQGTDVTVTIRDEAGKIDLNAAQAGLLAGLFRQAGLEAAAADALVNTLLDWVDADDQKRLNGAEAADYAAAGVGYRPANGPFETVEELRLLLGMTPALFERLYPLVTVYSRAEGVNAAAAPREVLLALPGVTPAQVELFLAQRQAALDQGLPMPVLPGYGSANPQAAGTLHVRVDIPVSAKTTTVHEVVVRITNATGPATLPYAILAWHTAARAAAPLPE